MTKIYALLISITLIVYMVATPVFAGGDKNHGSVGQGNVDQGNTADAPGDNAQGNQVDP